MSRRFVFGVVAAALAVMVLGGILVWTAGGSGPTRAAALEESKSSYDVSWRLYGGTTAQTFWGDLESVAGCDAQGEVATVKGTTATTGTGTKKHLSGVSPSPCRLEILVNPNVHRDLYAWINDTFSETFTRKNLTLVKTNSMGIALRDVLIERIDLPAFASNGTELVTLGLTVRAEETARQSSPAVTGGASGKLTGAARTSYFDVAVSGLGSSLRPSRFEPWSATVQITRGPAGPGQTQANQATTLTLGDLGLSITVGERSSGADRADDLHNWFHSFVVQGNSTDAHERTLTLTVRDPTQTTSPPLMTLTFTNVGIFGEPSYWLANNPEKFLFYAEGVSLTGLPAPSPPPPPAAPPAPASLEAVVEGSVVNLSWEPVKAPSYKVLYSTEPGGPYKLLRETSEPTLTAELPPATYYFVVRAVNGETESENSNEVSGELAG